MAESDRDWDIESLLRESDEIRARIAEIRRATAALTDVLHQRQQRLRDLAAAARPPGHTNRTAVVRPARSGKGKPPPRLLNLIRLIAAMLPDVRAGVWPISVAFGS